MNATEELFPLTPTDGLVTVLFSLTSMLSAIGGIGGGGIYVSLMALFLGFSTDVSVPLSNCIIFLSSIISLLLRFVYHKIKNQKDYASDRNFIDIDICLILVPMSIAGTIVGILLHLILPSIVVIFILIIIMLTSMITTFNQAYKIKKIQNQPQENYFELQSNRIPFDEEINFDVVNSRTDSHLLIKYSVLTIILLITLGFSIGKKYINCDNDWYWIIMFSPILFILCSQLSHSYYLIDVMHIEDDFILTKGRLWIYPLIAFVGGIMSSLVGIGTGTIISPLLYAISRKKNTTYLTNIATFIVCINTGISTIQYILFSKLLYDYALWFGLFSCGGSLCGFYLSRWIEKKNKKYYIVIIMGLIIMISGMLLLISAVNQIIGQDELWHVNLVICS